ncbi:hypothetical protein ACTXJK_14830 [Brachybacterium tyrofermentans]|uniref:hypothetical protein n=1 Tax=Brachybacterium tyrofermentans TaxID=47848 RepID=UPI003FD34CFD
MNDEEPPQDAPSPNSGDEHEEAAEQLGRIMRSFDIARLFPRDLTQLYLPKTKLNLDIGAAYSNSIASNLINTPSTLSALSKISDVTSIGQLSSLDYLNPRSMSAMNIIQSRITEAFDQQWRSMTDPLGSFVTNWLGRLDLPDFQTILKSLERRTIPDNLAELGIDEEDIESIAEVLHDGIPLFWVPQARIAKRLIAAQTTAERRTIIGRNLSAIVEDCLETLELISNEEYFYEADRLREAAELLHAHPAAAQALATVTLDSLMFRIAGTAEKRHAIKNLITSDGGRSKKGHEEATRKRLQVLLGNRGSLALTPVRAIYKQDVPTSAVFRRELNRHASLHKVNPLQYSKRNAAISLMLGTSVVLYMSRWFDDELRRAQQRAERTT